LNKGNYIPIIVTLVIGLIMSVEFPFPSNIAREGKWFVASCPLLDIATKGRSEEEIKANIADD
jgi:hypothetical protein